MLLYANNGMDGSLILKSAVKLEGRRGPKT